MNCPVCDSYRVRTIDIRHNREYITRRRKECQDCFTRFTTYETVAIDRLDPYIRKKFEEKRRKNIGDHIEY